MVNCKYRCYIREEPRPILVGRHSSVVATCFVCHYRREGKTPVLDLLHDNSYHVFVTQESEQLAGKSTVPESAISRCQIYNTNTYGTGLSFCFKRVLNVLGQQNCLIRG